MCKWRFPSDSISQSDKAVHISPRSLIWGGRTPARNVDGWLLRGSPLGFWVAQWFSADQRPCTLLCRLVFTTAFAWRLVLVQCLRSSVFYLAVSACIRWRSCSKASTLGLRKKKRGGGFPNRITCSSTETAANLIDTSPVPINGWSLASGQSSPISQYDQGQQEASPYPQPTSRERKRTFPEASTRSSTRTQQRTPKLHNIVRSATKTSQELFGTPKKKATGRSDDSASWSKESYHENEDYKSSDEDERYCHSEIDEWASTARDPFSSGAEEDRCSAKSPARSHGNTRRSKHYPFHEMEDERHSTGTWQQNYERISEPREYRDQLPARRRQQQLSPVRQPQFCTNPFRAEDGSSAEEAAESSMSDFEGNRNIARMNGLLDIWDAKDNPTWEEKTFKLCDLGHCKECGRFYVPTRTASHTCRAPVRVSSHEGDDRSPER